MILYYKAMIKYIFRGFLLLILVIFTIGCTAGQQLEPTATAEPTVTVEIQEPPTAEPTATADNSTEPTPVATETTQPERGEEAIAILSPGPGSRVVSPLQVEGIADPTFEQVLVVRLLTADGTELARQSTTIEAEIGERGPFAAEIPFTVSGEQQAFIQVFATSARDGGVTHLASNGITIADSGETTIVSGKAATPERIAIFQPENNATISGGTVHVEGFALASFEQTLIVDVQDADGNVIATMPIIVEAPDLGQPGPFRADLSFDMPPAGPGRVVVRDPSPAFGGDVHLSSVDITFQ